MHKQAVHTDAARYSRAAPATSTLGSPADMEGASDAIKGARLELIEDVGYSCRHASSPTH